MAGTDLRAVRVRGKGTMGTIGFLRCKRRKRGQKWDLRFKQFDVGAREMSGASIRINLNLIAGYEVLDNLHVEYGWRSLKWPFAHSIIKHPIKYDPASLKNFSVPICGILDLECYRVLSGVLHHPENASVMEMNV
jgi:hypothetical protein